jgi:hypothetical protein
MSVRIAQHKENSRQAESKFNPSFPVALSNTPLNRHLVKLTRTLVECVALLRLHIHGSRRETLSPGVCRGIAARRLGAS